MPTFIAILVILASPLLSKSRGFASPFIQLATFAGLPFCVKPILYSIFSIDYVFQLDEDKLVSALAALAIYLGAAYAFAWILKFSIPDPSGPQTEVGSRKDERITFTTTGYILMFALPLFLVVCAILAHVNLSSPRAVRAFLSKQGMFYFLQPIFFIGTVLSAQLAHSVFVLKRIPALPTIGGFLMYCFIGGFSGYSGSLISMVFAMLLLLGAYKRMRLWPVLIVIAPVALAHATIYLHYRQAVIENPDSTYIGTATELFSNPANLVTILNRLDQMEVFVDGYHYLSHQEPAGVGALANVASQAIPRAWWPNKPPTFSTMMTAELMPDVYEQGSTANYNSLNEFRYLFGSVTGIVIGAVTLGIFLFVMNLQYAMSLNRLSKAAFYSLVLVSPFVTGFSAGFFNEAAIPMLCINLLCYGVFVRVKPIKCLGDAPTGAKPAVGTPSMINALS